MWKLFLEQRSDDENGHGLAMEDILKKGDLLGSESIKVFRKAAKQMMEHPLKLDRDGAPIVFHMTEDGVVTFPGGCMHPFTYRDFAGEEAYQKLVDGPRVPSLRRSDD
jgi:hypothetical protein